MASAYATFEASQKASLIITVPRKKKKKKPHYIHYYDSFFMISLHLK